MALRARAACLPRSRAVSRAAFAPRAAHALALALTLGLTLAPLRARADQRVLLLDTSSSAMDPAVRRQVMSALADALRGGTLQVVKREAKPAADPAQVGRRVEEAMAAAKRMSEQFQEKQAIARLEQAERDFRGAAPSGITDIAPLIAVLLMRAKLLADTGDNAGAGAALARVAVLDPQRSLDPGQFKPVLVRAFDGARKRLASETSKIRVSSTPSSLTLWIDGKRRASTPALVSVPAGEHFLAVGSTDHAVAGRALTVAPGGAAEVSLSAPAGAGVAGVPRTDNDLRALAAAAEADYTVALRVSLRGGMYQASLRIVSGRTIGKPRRVRSSTFDEDGTRSAMGKLALVALPYLGVKSDKGGDGDGDGSRGGSVFKKWWFWTIVGAALAAGGGVTAGLLLGRDNSVKLRLQP